ncbi:MAG TPA: alginate export family protein [Terracidiphilus sp.]|nr:alginate export family protein [Terracidiphilus sp.]
MNSLRRGAVCPHRPLSLLASLSLAISFSLAAPPATAQAASTGKAPISVFVYDRTRMDAWDWFEAPPASNSYAYVQTLQRIGMTQRLHRWDWELELSQPAIFDVPDNAIAPVSAQGQLGLGGTYYAANLSSYPAAAFLKQGFVRFDGEDKNLRVGRFEFMDGMETKPRNSALAWLQANRVASRLISNFGFTNAQRSLDGVDGQWQSGTWNVTAMAARSDQGVFNMNGNPELNVDIQYLALTHPQAGQHVLWRVFAAGYHDGRTGVTKTDNRALAVRAADHTNIRIGTYGGNLTADIPAGPGSFDFLFWGALQNGRWGSLSQSAGAAALEAGYRMGKQAAAPWLRGGWFRSTGDKNPADGTHNTFFQLLPTPRLYARLPFYNLMNSTDEFVQLIDNPVKRLALRSDLHWLQLTSGHDLWYQGGGAFDNKVFGFVGRPANNATSFASVPDISADWQTSSHIDLNFYYAYAQGKTVVAAIYPSDHNMQFGYVEFVYHWRSNQPGTGKK